VWENVTPAGVDDLLHEDAGSFGLGSIVTDPGHPSDMYVGGYGTLFKSTDYGLTWKSVPSNPNPGYAPLGNLVAVAGTTPATVWVAGPCCDKYVYKSTDAGLTFKLTGTVVNPKPDMNSFYSIVVDPNANKHLLTGLHETGGLLESTDGGDTWKILGGNGWPSTGVSWYPFFVNTGNPATTSKTWFAYALVPAQRHRRPATRSRERQPAPDRQQLVRHRHEQQRHFPQHRPRQELDTRRPMPAASSGAPPRASTSCGAGPARVAGSTKVARSTTAQPGPATTGRSGRQPNCLPGWCGAPTAWPPPTTPSTTSTSARCGRAGCGVMSSLEAVFGMKTYPLCQGPPPQLIRKPNTVSHGPHS
jgi:hypothetical protein